MALDKKFTELAKEAVDDVKKTAKQAAAKAVDVVDDRKKELSELSDYLFSEYKKSADVKKRAAIQKWRALLDSLKL